ncbi:hypothetical protein [Desulfurococcus mucosus]|nr:hypothetical protein [Desulfurococcus mucosus]
MREKAALVDCGAVAVLAHTVVLPVLIIYKSLEAIIKGVRVIN